MRKVRFALGAIVSAIVSTAVWAQSTAPPFLVNAQSGRIGLEFVLRAEPPSSPLQRRFTASSNGRSTFNGPTFASRVLRDSANRVYLGYELLIEPQQPGEYLATFGKLGVTALEIAANGTPRAHASADGEPSNSPPWTMLQLPAIPEPRVVHDGDLLTIDLFAVAATGEKLVDYIRINQPHPLPSSLPKAPTVSGIARDFSVTDAELQIIQPRVTFNRKPQISSGPASLRSVRGALIWLYFPDHGRFVLSLLPRPALGFKKAGEVRGGVLTFTLDEAAIRLECMTAIANGNAAYNLYVLHEADWEPTSESQKDWPGSGTVGADELAALKRK